MNCHWIRELYADREAGRKRLAALLDPDDVPMGGGLEALIRRIEASPVTDVFLGGSLLTHRQVDDVIAGVRAHFSGPLTLFPGSPEQVVAGADQVLFLTLISGRNPDLLIGRHVASALHIRRLGMPVVPTGYLLIGDGPLTTAAYISGTLPIPSAKPGIAVATAVAGEMLGLQLLYLDAGSGAGSPVPVETIAAVREQTSVPLVVGGGLRNAEAIRAAWAAGADVVVVGSAIEDAPGDLAWLPQP
jgi:putative glycerol-1-phosphate prenyltransferase